LEVRWRGKLVRDHDLVCKSLLFGVILPLYVASPSFALFSKLFVVVNVGNFRVLLFRMMDILIGTLDT